MAKIELKMENFASEADFTAAIQQATAALPAGMAAEPATQVRDSNGKLVSAAIGIPSNATAQERTAARDAIVNANPGVSKATALPAEMSEDFNLLTPGDPIAPELIIDDGTVNSFDQGNSALKAAASVDSEGGTGSAIEMYDTTGTNGVHNFISRSGGLLFLAGSNELDQVSAFVMECDVKVGTIGDDGNVEKYQVVTIAADNGSGGYVRLKCFDGGNWKLQAQGGWNIDTGVSSTASYIHLKVTRDQNGLLTGEAGSAVVTHDFGFTKVSQQIKAELTALDRWSTVPTVGQYTGKSVFMDNYSLTITGI